MILLLIVRIFLLCGWTASRCSELTCSYYKTFATGLRASAADSVWCLLNTKSCVDSHLCNGFYVEINTEARTASSFSSWIFCSCLASWRKDERCTLVQHLTQQAFRVTFTAQTLCYCDSVGVKTAIILAYSPCDSPSSTPAFKFTDCVLKHGYFTQRTLTIVSERTGLPLFRPFRSESYPANPPVNLLGLRVDPTTIPSWSRSGFRHTRRGTVNKLTLNPKHLQIQS